MEWFPALKPGWLNGWVLLVSFYAVFGLLILIFPHPVVKRLYDQAGWSRSQRRMSALAKFIAGINFLLVFLTPLKTGTGVYPVGLLLYMLGVVLMVSALAAFRQAPLDQPVSAGVYRFSRNPQWLSLVWVMLGIAVAIGSWTVVLLTTAIAVFGHFRILAEEQTCLCRYGEPYREYMERVPRYLVF